MLFGICSKDGRTFRKIGEVPGKGTTADQQQYSFLVKNPENGLSYFRLKQLDFDGQFEYSNIVNVNYKNNLEMVGEWYPNPTISRSVKINYTIQIAV